jgi:hypothetical protein
MVLLTDPLDALDLSLPAALKKLFQLLVAERINSSFA